MEEPFFICGQSHNVTRCCRAMHKKINARCGVQSAYAMIIRFHGVFGGYVHSIHGRCSLHVQNAAFSASERLIPIDDYFDMTANDIANLFSDDDDLTIGF